MIPRIGAAVKPLRLGANGEGSGDLWGWAKTSTPGVGAWDLSKNIIELTATVAWTRV
jgi:hypothetical protein